MKFLFFLLFSLVLVAPNLNAQSVPKNWYLLDYSTDSFYGISLKKAYQFLEQKKIVATPIIVAVLDSGIDTLHEDLKNILWKNPKEIPNNNIDDDGNGLIDDVYGWNFLGNINGNNLEKTNEEKTRLYYKYKIKFENQNLDTNQLSKSELTEYKTWQRAAAEINNSETTEMEVSIMNMTLKAIKKYDNILKIEFGKETYSSQELEKLTPKTSEGKKGKYGYLASTKLLEFNVDETNTAIIAQLEEYIEDKNNAKIARENTPPNFRDSIIKDVYYNINDQFYGNKFVNGKKSMHGTHVSGIIAAERNNNTGIDGIATNAKIMSLRVVPDGDEYDKDIALGIFYAVKNGAKVINMSFGKAYSPEKNWVDSAVKFAAQNDVLIVHAAGNDGNDIDVVPSFPSPNFLNSFEKATNFITVGASTDPKISYGKIVAYFSNYGKKTVEVFAPGVNIYSTVPDINNYETHDGTSFSAPIVSGIAALLRSNFPSLSAIQTKEIIEQSVFIPNIAAEAKIKLGWSLNEEKNTLKDVCKTEGIVNAYNAVMLAFKVDEDNKKINSTNFKK